MFEKRQHLKWLLGAMVLWTACNSDNHPPKTTQSIENQKVISVPNLDNDCYWLNEWFKEACADTAQYTRFACNGTEPFIVEEVAEHDWCTGVGYLRVKPLFRSRFAQEGREKILLLVGMIPEKYWTSARLKECILGGAIWELQAEKWVQTIKTDMFVFLQSSLHEPMEIQLQDKQRILLRFTERKQSKTMTIEWAKGQFEATHLEE